MFLGSIVVYIVVLGDTVLGSLVYLGFIPILLGFIGPIVAVASFTFVLVPVVGVIIEKNKTVS